MNADYIYKIIKGVTFEVDSSSFIDTVSNEFTFIIKTTINNMDFIFFINL